MGAGPVRYLEASADLSLTDKGFEVEVETVEREGLFEDKFSAVADVNARLAERVREAVGRGGFPLVLGGNCDKPEQRIRLENSAIQVIASDEIESGLHDALTDLSSRVDEIYLHIDIDSLDPLYAPGVDFPAPNGLSVEDVETAVSMVARIFRIRAASLTAYNPDKDEENKTLQAGMRLLATVAEAVAGSEKEVRHDG